MSKVATFHGNLKSQGKGSYPRFDYQCSKEYKKNYDKIFKKENK